MKKLPSKYLFIGAELLSDLGNQFIHLALLNLLVFQDDGSLCNLLVMCVFQQAPAILLSPFAGLLIDRVGGKRWLIVILSCKCLLLCFFLIKSCHWVLFSAYLGFIICSLFYDIGRRSLTPVLILKEELISFNSLTERVCLAARILGPFMIGWIILKTGHGVVLGLAGLFFVFSTLSIHLLPNIGQTTGDQTGHLVKIKGHRPLLSEYKETLRTNNGLKPLFIVFGFVLLGGGVLNFGLPIFFKTHFGKTIADWGMVMSGFEAGSCLATFLLPRCSTVFSRQTIFSVTFIVLAGAMALLCKLTSFMPIFILMIVFGCGFTLMHVFLESLIQQNSVSAHMGKTMSLLSAYQGACYLGAILCSAFILKIFDIQSLLLCGSLVMLSASFFAKIITPLTQKCFTIHEKSFIPSQN